MAARKRKRVREADLQGLKQLDRLMPLLERLRPVGCARDKAGNRELFFDQYCALLLLYLFNPIVSSLRALQQASELKKVQRKLGCPRASLGSLSEAARVFDPERLREIVSEMVDQTPPLGHDARLNDLTHALTAVDGSILVALPQITQAAFCQKKRGPAPDGWRLHAHFEILRGVPVKMAVTDARNTGDSNEKAVLRRSLEPDRCYVTDRGYEQFSLFNAIVDVGSSYVCRIRNDHFAHFQPDETRPLSETAIRQGVLDDGVGTLGSPQSKRIEHPHHRVRLVRVKVTPHPKRGGRKRQAASQEIVLATNLLDVPPEIIALIYQHRWLIELFFRFFKHVLGCRHLLSQHPQGMEIQTYCAIIACLLIAWITGKKPTLRTYEMLCYYFIGLADEEELLAHLSRLKSHES
jgi:hypothetical protein